MSNSTTSHQPEFGYECPECGAFEHYYYNNGRCMNCGFNWYFPYQESTKSEPELEPELTSAQH